MLSTISVLQFLHQYKEAIAIISGDSVVDRMESAMSAGLCKVKHCGSNNLARQMCPLTVLQSQLMHMESQGSSINIHCTPKQHLSSTWEEYRHVSCVAVFLALTIVPGPGCTLYRYLLN